ncbi:hypothetical protein PybrP1_000426 [[Pythium] brassicae (nom. inval.)]|nr:hypothetical protein PybrP1_000426 [[Pythium] brassicae (nom. inval.)]
MTRLNLESARKVHRVLVLVLLVCSSSVADAQRSMRMAETQRELVGDTAQFDALPPLPPPTATPVDTTLVGAVASQLVAVASSDAVVPAATVADVASLATTTTTSTVSAEADQVPEQDESQVETATTVSSGSSSSASATTELTSSGLALGMLVDSLKATTATTEHSSGSSSGSGSNATHDYEFGEGNNKMYKCECSSLQRVSLMGRSNYCLPQRANVNDKCGNVNLGAKGECPRRGAEPCSPELGYNLTQDSMCLLDDRDNVFKCVASTEDLERLRNSGKKKLKSAQSNATAAAGSAPPSSAAASRRPTLALHAVTLIATLALGVATLL